jgi:hypothetical protein
MVYTFCGPCAVCQDAREIQKIATNAQAIQLRSFPVGLPIQAPGFGAEAMPYYPQSEVAPSVGLLEVPSAVEDAAGLI